MRDCFASIQAFFVFEFLRKGNKIFLSINKTVKRLFVFWLKQNLKKQEQKYL
jgi:hypothetical protein